MAVYTPVSDVEVTEFLQNYEIGDLISLTEITEGVENSNFLLKTSIDSYILTLYEKRVNAEDLPFFIGTFNSGSTTIVIWFDYILQKIFYARCLGLQRGVFLYRGGWGLELIKM